MSIHQSTEGMVTSETPNYESDYGCVPATPRRGYTAGERRRLMRNNVSEIISNSTITPFRWLRKLYRCFFCDKIFKAPKEWRTHQEIHDIKTDLSEALKNYWESTVNVDVTDIGCRLCSDVIADINELTDHLVKKHRIKFNQDIGSCMSGFKFDDALVCCVICEKKFATFSHVLVHSHREHKRSTEVLCDICGQNYKSLNYLRHHIKSEHSGGVKCNQCGVLLRYTKIRTHMQNAHGRKYKCSRCHELFETQYKRAHHTMLAHGDREMISCQYCTRTFVFRSTMTRHVRETHLRERNAECGVCGWRTFGEYALQRHMLKHSSIKDIKCPSCDKTFKTKKTMKQHCLNIHKKS